MAKTIKFGEKIDGNNLILIGDSLISKYGLNKHNLESADAFYSKGINQIINNCFSIYKIHQNTRSFNDEDKAIDYIECRVVPFDINLKPPVDLVYQTGSDNIAFPNSSLLRKKIYSGTLSISATITAIAHLKNGSVIERTDTMPPTKICKLPIVKGSILCNTYKKSKEALQKLGEDPSDPAGYFVVSGEWSVDLTENITFNQPKIYINEGFGKSLVRLEFISKPGDSYQNSDYLLIQFYNDNTLTIDIARDKIKGIQFPFYMIFRAFGWNNDKDILDYIIMDYDSEVNKKLLTNIMAAMEARYQKFPPESRYAYGANDNLKFMIDSVSDENQISYKYLDLKNKPEHYNNAMNDMMRIFDNHCLPHIGMSSESRHEKLKFISLLIRKLLLVYNKNIPQTDRDSYRNKRVHAIGENYAKVFKTYFNQAIVIQIKKKMTKEFNTTSFSKINLINMVKNAIYAEDFERAIVQAIVTGNRAQLNVKRKSITNRLSAQNIHRKNQLNVYATLRQIIATSAESAKQSERANEMRRVHQSAIGFICPNHSPPEGEKVGINKQMCLFTTIATPSSSEVLKKIISDDKDIISDFNLKPVEIFRRNLARIYVNGHLIGYAVNALAIATKYRKMRRKMEINIYTTIYWDNIQNEVQFFVDIGRLIRPLIIVYNTQRDREFFDEQSQKQFEQGINITQADIDDLFRSNKTIDDLIQEGKVEYISPEEQENCYICPNYTQLMDDKNNEYKEYTHCDIEISQLGLTAATAPFGNHNNAPRVTYQTSQVKQTAGCYALNWPFRMDKEAFLQYTNEVPLVRTITNKYIFPNGCNVKVAIMCYSGYNQEDSLIINKSAVERGLFDGSKFTFYETEFEQKEELGNPDINKTDGINETANYSKLVNGLVKQGDRIEKNDVLIGKFIPISKNQEDSRYLYLDKSVIYRDSEPAVVTHVIYHRTDEELRFCRVGLKKVRPVEVGDKASSRAGQKGIFSLLMREADMPFDAITGETPSLIFNPHGIPSRMTVSQMIESLMGNLCAVKGGHSDATMFKPVDIESIANELEQHGFNRYGFRRMISGITGEFIDMLVFEGPVYYQRLLKHVKDAEYSVRNAMTDPVTMQPTESTGSQSVNKGLRIGEMEKDVALAIGMSGLLQEKFTDHSDGYIEYMCRCGNQAIVNTKSKLYKCQYCGDNADIYAMPTTYTSKLLRQELQSINVGVKVMPKPYNYEIYDDINRTLSQIENYGSDVIDKIKQTFDESIETDKFDADE